MKRPKHSGLKQSVWLIIFFERLPLVLLYDIYDDSVLKSLLGRNRRLNEEENIKKLEF